MMIVDGKERCMVDVILRTGFTSVHYSVDEITHEFDDIGRSHFYGVVCFHEDVCSFEKHIHIVLEKYFKIHSVQYIKDAAQLIVEHQSP